MPFFTTNPLMLYITWYSFHAFTKRVFVRSFLVLCISLP